MKKQLLYIFLFISTFMIYSQDLGDVELPEEYYLGEIIHLDPYPVPTTRSNASVRMEFLTLSGYMLPGVHMILTFTDGSRLESISDENGSIAIESDRQIEKMYILGDSHGEAPTLMDEDRAFGKDELQMHILLTDFPVMIDLDPFPADKYVFTFIIRDLRKPYFGKYNTLYTQ